MFTPNKQIKPGSSSSMSVSEKNDKIDDLLTPTSTIKVVLRCTGSKILCQPGHDDNSYFNSNIAEKKKKHCTSLILIILLKKS